MSGSSAIEAAGAVVLRRSGGERQVLVVHRPQYDDWTLPKGKQERDEPLQATAVREMLEETGVGVYLGSGLSKVSYPIGKGRKEVHWWGASVRGQGIPPLAGDPHTPLQAQNPDEVDQVSWLSLAQARSLLSYDDEIQLLELALQRRSVGTLILVRHGKAMARKHWSGKDWLRPLTDKGRRQAERLVPLLGAYGVGEVWSSTSTRCVQTVSAYASVQHIKLHTASLLSEEEGIGQDERVQEFMWRLRTQAVRKPRVPVVVCGHRPVLPAMMAGLHIDVRPLSVAQCLVVHLDKEAEPMSVESIKTAG